MKAFHCDHCGALVFFENVECLSCKHALAFLPDIGVVASLEPAADCSQTLWLSPLPAARGRRYRLCANYTTHRNCNWALESTDPEALCQSCRLTTIVPDANDPEQRAAWYKLENAKRRLVYTLRALSLAARSKVEEPLTGLAFEFRMGSEAAPVITGHDNGVITINTAEADDAKREQLRNQLYEPYRTLLGHFRHEVGHYYWDRLIAGTDRLQPFRALFGNETQDYSESLQTHYQNGPPTDWQQRFVSSYSSSHPWEDWAETWAHYLHMFDTLETATACGLSLQPRRTDEPALVPSAKALSDFDQMIERWFPLTYALNSLNRGLGLSDAYPFVLSPLAIDKLRFVHETIRQAGACNGAATP